MAIQFDLIQPNGIQMQNMVDKPVAYPAQNDSIAIPIAPASGTVTVQAAAAVELKSGASALAGRTKLIVKNPSIDTAVRIGGSTITTKRGYLLEPQGTVTIEQNSATAVAVYGRSTGWEVPLEVYES